MRKTFFAILTAVAFVAMIAWSPPAYAAPKTKTAEFKTAAGSEMIILDTGPIDNIAPDIPEITIDPATLTAATAANEKPDAMEMDTGPEIGNIIYINTTDPELNNNAATTDPAATRTKWPSTKAYLCD